MLPPGHPERRRRISRVGGTGEILRAAQVDGGQGERDAASFIRSRYKSTLQPRGRGIIRLLKHEMLATDDRWETIDPVLSKEPPRPRGATARAAPVCAAAYATSAQRTRTVMSSAVPLLNQITCQPFGWALTGTMSATKVLAASTFR